MGLWCFHQPYIQPTTSAIHSLLHKEFLPALRGILPLLRPYPIMTVADSFHRSFRLQATGPPVWSSPKLQQATALWLVRPAWLPWVCCAELSSCKDTPSKGTSFYTAPALLPHWPAGSAVCITQKHLTIEQHIISTYTIATTCCYSMWTAPHSLVPLASLLRVHSIHCPCCQQRCLLNSVSPNANPWGTPLITYLHLDIKTLTIFESDYPANSLSTEQSIHQISFSQV